MYHGVALQLAQLLGQRALGGFRNQASKLSKTKCVVPKVIEDGNLVFSADNIQGGVDRGIVAGFGVFSTAFRSSISAFFQKMEGFWDFLLQSTLRAHGNGRHRGLTVYF